MADTMTLKIGADPELFIRNVKSRSFISAHNMFPGTKKEPHKVAFGAVQVDGLALEYNIRPCNYEFEFIQANSVLLAYMNQMVQDKHDDWRVCITPSATFRKDYYSRLPEEAKLLGCDPDYDAYTGEIKKVPELKDKPLRTASGHIHIGWTEDMDVHEADFVKNCAEITQQLDVAFVIPSFLWDKCMVRRHFYGTPGTFRPKAYGVEYRVLSNQWLKNTKLMSYVYKTAKAAIEDYAINDINYFEIVSKEIIDAYIDEIKSTDSPDEIDQVVKEYFEDVKFLTPPEGL